MMIRQSLMLAVLLLTGCTQFSGAAPEAASDPRSPVAETAPAGLPKQDPLPQPAQADTVKKPVQPLHQSLKWESNELEMGREGMIFTLERILFAVNSYTLDQQATHTLLKVAEFLRKHSDVQVIVEGHADEEGPDDYNGHLSEQRALAVYRRLLELGIPDSMLRLVAHGEKYPTESVESGKEISRRVEIVVSKSTKPVEP